MNSGAINNIYRRGGKVLRSHTELSLLRYAMIWGLLSLVSILHAQEERGLTREGNKQFGKEKYSDAEASYKKALEVKNNFPEAVFNLGDAMYKQGRYDDAAKQFLLASTLIKDTTLKAQAYHNMGNCSMEKKEYEEAVKSYKQALKINPRDIDTKYNLAYANAKLKDKQQNKQDQKDNKNQQNKDNKKDQDKKDQDKKGDQKKEGDKGDKGDKQDKKAGGKLTKEQADKLLQALSAEEQKTQEKMQKKMAKPQEVKVQKDW